MDSRILLGLVVLLWITEIYSMYTRYKYHKIKQIRNRKFRTFKFVQTKHGTVCYEEIYLEKGKEPIIKIKEDYSIENG